MADGTLNTVIPRGCTIPGQKIQYFTTVEDNQTSIEMTIYEGLFLWAASNSAVGRITLSGIEPKPKGEARIQVIFLI